MKLLLNSNLFPIVKVGMYHTFLSPENHLNSDCIEQDIAEGHIIYNEDYFWSNFDNDAYNKHVKEIVEQYISEVIDDLKPFINSIEVGDIYSPKYYNFATDQIDLTVDYNKEELLKFAYANIEEFSNFLKGNYSSYSGFISLTSNNFEDWVEEFNNGNEQEVGAILTFISDYIDISDWNDFVIYGETPLYSEFMTDFAHNQINEIESEVKNYVQKYYAIFNAKDIIEQINNDAVDLQGLNKNINIAYLVCNTIKDIENQTLKLF